MTTQDSRTRFVTAMEAAQGIRLRRFIASRVREGMADFPDMVQEVYLRLLRVEEPETIQNPEAYLLTIAKHVLYEHRTRRAPTTGAVNLDRVIETLATDPAQTPEAHALSRERTEFVRNVLAGLSPKAHAALILHRVEGLTLEEIGKRLGVSRSMAKKYVAKALVHCRTRVEGQ